MIRSMTGFGQGSAELDGLRLTVELRSVNNRHTDLRFRMPGELSAWEADLRKKILTRVRRGRVEATIWVEHPDGADARPVLNKPLLAEAIAAARSVREDYGIQGELDVNTVLSLSGLIKMESPEIQWAESQRETLYQALDQALEALHADREREGEALRSEMLERVGTMVALAAEMRRRAGQVPSIVRERLLQRLNALSGEVELDPARVAQEATYLAERCDVTEEIVRLEGHLAQAGSLLAEPDGEPMGKRLDFLLQEIHRETNTVCSKSAELDLTRGALALKAETEKIREQTQNLE